MVKKKTTRYLSIFLGVGLIISCATAPVEDGKPEPEKTKLSVEEQEKKSLESYKEILEMTAKVRRRTILEQLKEKYIELINEYPDSYYAEESYLHLITMNFKDYAKPKVDEAEHYYKEYFKNYPEPRLNNMINDTMARNYYRYGYWERLANFLAPHIEKYATKGELPKTFYFFIYCEALFGLGDYEEAEKGYLTIIRLYPDSHEAKVSKKKLEKLKALTEENKKGEN
jgi:tetratricopeptide (TPR) repeat protein